MQLLRPQQTRFTTSKLSVMSNKPTIEQKSREIAIFMGLKPIQAGTKRLGDIKPPEISEAFLNYHDSWDALMPCWSKLRDKVADHFDEDYPAEYCSMCDIWALECEHVNINGAYNLLCQAIQWYNNQKEVTNG
jgi:hypothetical protein